MTDLRRLGAGTTPARDDVDRMLFEREIVPAGRPVVLRGLAESWPAARLGKGSPQAIADYIKKFSGDRPVEILLGPPSIRGYFFYRDGLSGVNFVRRQANLAAAVDKLLSLMDEAPPPALYIQSAPIADYLPQFGEENKISLLDGAVAPRIWIGNAVTVQTHFDLSENIACVVAGRKRFTLFPPEQVANLYPGPLEFTLSGPPVSMVRLDELDFERYPRFRDAIASAEVAELEPGDALYIPYHWWHHVESLDPFNVLVNYWWGGSRPDAGSPRDCLLHALIALRTLPPRQRAVWRDVFDYYVFETHGDPVAHLPPARRGVLGDPSPDRLAQMRAMLAGALARSAKPGGGR